MFGTTNTAIPATSTTTTSQPTSTTTATITPGGGLNFGTSSFSLSTKPAETTTTTSTTTPATTPTAQPALTLSTGTSAQTTTSTNDIKPTIGLFSTPKSENKTTTTSLTNQQKEQTPTNSSTTTTTIAGNLPQILSFNVPSLTPTKSDPNKSTLGGVGLGTIGTSATSQIGLTLGSSSNTPATSAAVAAAAAVVIRSQLPKDQPLPQPLIDCVENFK